MAAPARPLLLVLLKNSRRRAFARTISPNHRHGHKSRKCSSRVRGLPLHLASYDRKSLRLIRRSLKRSKVGRSSRA
jgi:hypothetical protein